MSDDGKRYYIEHGWSGCEGTVWSKLTQATQDGWDAAARESARLDALVADLRKLADEWEHGHRPVHWRGHLADLRAVLDKHAGEPT